jgi:MFS family permease
MSRFWLGVLSGVVYGALSAASMLPLSFPDKRAALLGAFLSRFAIGVAIGVAIGAAVGSPQLQRLGMPAWAIGLLLGLLISFCVIGDPHEQRRRPSALPNYPPPQHSP